MMQEPLSLFLRRQAELCIALSRSTFDLALAGRLRAMADEFRSKASRCDDEIDDFHPHAYGSNGNGSLAGNSSRT